MKRSYSFFGNGRGAVDIEWVCSGEDGDERWVRGGSVVEGGCLLNVHLEGGGGGPWSKMENTLVEVGAWLG